MMVTGLQDELVKAAGSGYGLSEGKQFFTQQIITLWSSLFKSFQTRSEEL